MAGWGGSRGHRAVAGCSSSLPAAPSGLERACGGSAGELGSIKRALSCLVVGDVHLKRIFAGDRVLVGVYGQRAALTQQQQQAGARCGACLWGGAGGFVWAF